QVDATARTVQFVAQFLVRWARGLTKAAVYATSQNLFCHVAVGGAPYPGCQFGLHGSELAEKSAGIEHSGRVQLLLQPPADRQDTGGGRVKDRYGRCALVPVKCCMAAMPRSRLAHEVGLDIGSAQPAQATVPFHQRIAQTERRRGGRQSQPPQWARLKGGMGLIAQAVPICSGLGRLYPDTADMTPRTF